MGKIAAIIPALTAVATIGSAGAGIYSTVKSMQAAKEKPPTPQPLPNAPTQGGAQESAAEQLAKRRRQAIQYGNTDITKGSAILNQNNVSQKTLVGQ